MTEAGFDVVPDISTGAAALRGDLAAESASRCREVLAQLAGHASGDLVIDATGLTSIDHDGIVAIMATHRLLASTRRQLWIEHTRPSVARALMAAGLEPLLR